MWDPFREISRLDKKMDRLIREIWESGEREMPKRIGTSEGLGLPAPKGSRMPAVDVKETDSELTVIADMPGIKKEDINIEMLDNQVKIKAETKGEKKEEKEGYVYQERRSESYYRTVELPAAVDTDKAKASYRDGVLNLTIPKTKKVKKTKVEIE